MWNNAYGAFSALQGLSQSRRGNRKRASVQNGGKEQWRFAASKAKQKAERLFWQGLEGNLSVQKITSKTVAPLMCLHQGRGANYHSALLHVLFSMNLSGSCVFFTTRMFVNLFSHFFPLLILRLCSVMHYLPCLVLYKQEFDQDVSSQLRHRTK